MPEVSTDPEALLEARRNQNDSKKCRLFAAACCRRIWNHLSDDLRSAVQIAENFARDFADDDARTAAYRKVEQRCGYVDGDSLAAERLKFFGAEAVLCTLFGDNDYPPIPTYATTCAIAASRAVVEVVSAHAELSGDSDDTISELVTSERQWQSAYILREFDPAL